MKCNCCDAEMRLDDVDFNFNGNKDNCGTTAFEKIRYGKSISVEYQKEDGRMV